MKTLFTIAAIIATFLAQAGGTFSLIEINPLHGTEQSFFTDSSKTVYGAGELSGFVELNGKLYFSARNAYENDELWSTDGTAQGTWLVKDINPNGSAGISNLVKVGNRLMFMACDNNNTDFDLWSTDGTTEGTLKVAELDQTVNTALSAQSISVMGDRLLFCTQTQLMISDGTGSGTHSLLSIASYSQGFGYCELNNKVYFVLPGNSGGQEIWRTDGTSMGTEKILDLSAPQNNMNVSEMVSFNGKLYLNAAVIGQGNDVFSFDGSINGAIQKVILIPGGNSYPGNFILHNNDLYFTASNMTTANIYRIAAGSSTPVELIPGASFSWINNLTFANNSLYFLTEMQNEIHRVDLNSMLHSTTLLQGFTVPYYFITGSPMLVGNAGRVFMALYDSITGNQVLAEADETLAEINQITPGAVSIMHPFNFLLGCGTADIFDFKIWGNKLLLPANFNEAGRELWIFEANDLSGVDETPANELSFSMFPNPAHEELTLKMENNNYCEHQINITNTNGDVVMQKNWTGGATTIQLTDLPSGVYLTTLTESGKAVASRKLVVVK